MLGHRTRRASRVVAAGALVCATATGCRLSNLGNIQVTKDNRLTFVTPEDRELVKTPLTVSWTMKGGYTGAYGVFVDQAPIGVGDDLKAVAKDDSSCKRDPRCPDATYLAGRYVFVTTQTSVKLNFLPQASQGVGDEQHTVTVVLLDKTGTRTSESAWYLQFRYPRRNQ